jgi:hypothetical protein
MMKEVNQMQVLEALEAAALPELSKVLQPLLNSTVWILNHAPWIVELSKGKSQTISMRVQHMLLKYALTSLRATALLLVRGYTAQGATIASSLFETRLYSNYILVDETRADQFIKHTNSQEFVWRPSQMIRSEAEQNFQRTKKLSDTSALKKEAELIGASYLFLCSLKHGNPIPLRHVVGARDNIVGPAFADGGFPVIALPDTRPEDNIVKAVVLAAANNSAFYVVRNTGLTVNDETDKADKWFRELKEKWSQSVKQHRDAMDGLGKMPFPTIPK